MFSPTSEDYFRSQSNNTCTDKDIRFPLVKCLTSYLVDCESSLLWLWCRQTCQGGGGEQCQCTTAVAVEAILWFPPRWCCRTVLPSCCSVVSQGFMAHGHRWRPWVVCCGRSPSTKQSSCENKMQTQNIQTYGVFQMVDNVSINAVESKSLDNGLWFNHGSVWSGFWPALLVGLHFGPLVQTMVVQGTF